MFGKHCSPTICQGRWGDSKAASCPRVVEVCRNRVRGPRLVVHRRAIRLLSRASCWFARRKFHGATCGRRRSAVRAAPGGAVVAIGKPSAFGTNSTAFCGIDCEVRTSSTFPEWLRTALQPPHFLGAQTGPNPTDRRKRGSKHYVLMEANGIPVVATLTGANCHDPTQLIPLANGFPAAGGKPNRPVQCPRAPYRDLAQHSEIKALWFVT